MAVNGNGVPAGRQRLARGHAELPLHQIEAGDQLGHRMLHLQARVHLHEVEGVAIDQELDGAGAAVVDRLSGAQGGRAEGVAQRRIEARRRRSEEHTSELQSLMRISYAVFCLIKKKKRDYKTTKQ